MKPEMKNGERNRPDYTTEFRANAVKLSMQGETGIVALARDLGVSEGSLYTWVSRAGKEASSGLSADEREDSPVFEKRTVDFGRSATSKKRTDPVREGRLVDFERIDAVAEEQPASVVCEVLGVSRSSLYAYRARKRRPPTPRERENTKLDHTIATVFDENRRSDGRPRMQRALRARGIRIGDSYDNAVVESFNDEPKQELVHRHSWPTCERVYLAIADSSASTTRPPP